MRPPGWTVAHRAIARYIDYCLTWDKLERHGFFREPERTATKRDFALAAARYLDRHGYASEVRS